MPKINWTRIPSMSTYGAGDTKTNVSSAPRSDVFVSYASNSLSGIVTRFVARVFFARTNAKTRAKK